MNQYKMIMNQYKTLVDVAMARSKSIPDELLYTFLANGETIEKQLTFQQLDQSARTIAANLQIKYNVKKGDRVVLLFCPGLEFLEALFGCFYAGVIAVPVYPPGSGTTWTNYLSIVDNAEAVLILADNTKANFLLRHFKVKNEASKTPIINTNELDASLVAAYKKPLVDANEIALLQYTSGTTSLPKGVMITHDNIMHNEQLINKQITRDFKIGVSWLPLYHDMGLFGSVLQAMYVGGHCVLMPPSSFLVKPYRWLQAISEYHANISGCPNFAFDLCVEAIDDKLLDTLDLSQWQVAASGAEPVQAATLRRFADKFQRCGFSATSYVPCYGLAESTLLASANKLSFTQPPTTIAVTKEHLIRRVIELNANVQDSKEFVSCGVPETGSIIVVDPTEPLTAQRILPEDRVGELWLRSPSVAVGYWNNVESTQQVFNAVANGEGGYYRTGDLGFLHGGEVYIAGRIKDLIIIHGKNHYPSDIERTIQMSHEALALDSGAVFTVEINGIERVIVAQEVMRNHLQNLNTAEIITSIKSIVTKEHEIQVHGVMLLKPGAIFKTSSGKVKRSAVRDAYLANEFEPIADWKTLVLTNFLENKPTLKSIAKRSDVDIDEVTKEAIQQQLISWVANKLSLDIDEVDPTVSHSTLGLDSVDVMSLFGEVEKWLGITIDPEALEMWDLETLEDIARVLYQATLEPENFAVAKSGDENVEGFI